MLVYDITDPTTFTGVEELIPTIRQHAGDACVFLLVGNKSDLEHIRAVPVSAWCMSLRALDCSRPVHVVCLWLCAVCAAVAACCGCVLWLCAVCGRICGRGCARAHADQTSAGLALAEKYDMAFMETSARQGTQVNEAIEKLIART